MVYDIKSHCLLNGTKKVKLPELQHRLLLALSSTKLVTYEELAKFIYNSDITYTKGAIRTLLRNIKRKTKLKIETIRGVGLTLKDKIYFR